MIKHISTTSKHLWLSSGNFPYIDKARENFELIKRLVASEQIND